MNLTADNYWDALLATGGNQSEAGRLLGVSQNAVNSVIRHHRQRGSVPTALVLLTQPQRTNSYRWRKRTGTQTPLSSILIPVREWAHKEGIRTSNASIYARSRRIAGAVLVRGSQLVPVNAYILDPTDAPAALPELRLLRLAEYGALHGLTEREVRWLCDHGHLRPQRVQKNVTPDWILETTPPVSDRLLARARRCARTNTVTGNVLNLLEHGHSSRRISEILGQPLPQVHQLASRARRYGRA